ncbi:MAG: response regulator, partial [Lachnospiraceae bacterium]|nr:response regulator [Lachnospiraceae bacterium]
MDHTLLIVDDVDINRDILKELLIDEYKIIEASDGKEAIDIMEKEHGNIDAVLLDVVMPVMDGFEVLAVMRENGWLNDIPVLLITGDKSEDVEQRGFEMGISDYI